MMKKKRFRMLAAIFAIGLIAVVLVYKFVYNKPHPDYANEEPVLVTTAADLFAQFKDSTAYCNLNYNGKVVQLSGAFNQIEDFDTMMVVVFAFEEGMFGNEGIRCNVSPEYFTQFRNLKKQDVVIKGLCTGYNETDVILENCSLILN